MAATLPAMRAPVIRPLEWADGVVHLLDQTRLPHEEVVLACRRLGDVESAIRSLAVRGAPILGITAAFALAMVDASRETTLADAGARLVAVRPTAVNIRWAVERVLAAAEAGSDVLDEARAIEREDREACDAMGELGASLLPDGANVLTHCNTGMLCTAGIGTAQGVIHAAHRAGRLSHVWVDETRPVLQGARLTSWELQRLGIPMTLVPDGAAASLMAHGVVDAVVVGADRIAANGDVANKIGTYSLAVLAAHHDVPFHVVAPVSTIDLDTPDGARIPIEERAPEEVTAPRGTPFAPEGTPAFNPAFDATPASLVTAIVTERGIVHAPDERSVRALVSGSGQESRA